MASSSQDQSTGANTAQNQVSTSKHRFWLRLVITFIAFILLAVLILVLLTYFKTLPPQWFVPLLATLGPVFGTIGAFVNAILSDKDFQQSLKNWLTKRLFGDSDDSSKDGKSAIAQPNITINFSPTITNTNTATGTPVGDTQAHLQPAHSVAQQPADGSTMASPLAASAPVFFVNMQLTDPREFYGRGIDRTQLLSRTRNGGCTSIVGPRRSGKTWLMTYLRLVAAEQLGPNFCLGYLSAALPSSATRAGIIKEALKALGHPPYALPASPDLVLLEDFVRNMRAQNRTPVLCIDEFEGLTHHPAEFDLQFFEGLRAITEVGLGLVVLSKEPLIDLVSESTRTSPFFNVFLQLNLSPFERADAEQFVQEKGAQAQFTEQERAYLLAYGQSEKEQFPPLRLQLVGEMLLNEKRAVDSASQHHYRPLDPEFWQALKERLDAAYSGMVKS